MPSRLSDISGILLFDGDCGYCNAFVRWVFRHDTTRGIHFAPLNGPTSLSVLKERTDLSTVIFVYEGQVYKKSEAIFILLSRLPSPWGWLSFFRHIPLSVRDLGYDVAAKMRYRMSGKAVVCNMPEEALKKRVLP